LYPARVTHARFFCTRHDVVLIPCLDSHLCLAWQVGFMYVKGHGLSREVEQGILASSERFFGLEAGAKLALDAKQSPAYRGYNSFETGAHSCTPEEVRDRL
jgi:isopenicillin N synthase-like dioxygenase